jgi:hypothetical protein
MRALDCFSIHFTLLKQGYVNLAGFGGHSHKIILVYRDIACTFYPSHMDKLHFCLPFSRREQIVKRGALDSQKYRRPLAKARFEHALISYLALA